ncbi:MAG: Xaa-Pro peptidase family protein [Kiritimatiellae bacterium]|nr:Xaa-Pro peptidase family protein [Kiritimatiellia bacterium]
MRPPSATAQAETPAGGPPQGSPPEECRQRLEALRNILARLKLDGAWIVSPVNRLYYTGVLTSNGVLVVPVEGRPRLYTDFRYREAAAAAAMLLEVRPMPRRGSIWMTREERRRWRSIGFEAARVPWERAEHWRQLCRHVRTWRALDAAIAEQRAIKSPDELHRIRQAAAAADLAFARTLRELRPGSTEWDIRRRLRARLDELSEGESFPLIVATGPNASRCHHEPGLRRWAEGEVLLVDMGAVVGRYCSDMTRVVWAGRMPRRWRDLWRRVNDARAAAIEAVRPGVSAREVDAIARRHLRNAGLARFFGHGLGHGVGLEIHESPRLSQTSTDRLAAGMVVTIEPGVYLPGEGGVRIEDLVLVTDRGAEVLTQTPRDPEALVADQPARARRRGRS